MTQDTLFPDEDLPPGLEAAFWKFHGENPKVYRLICTYAQQAIAAGRTRLSIKMLFERIRWYTQVETTGEDFKLNNNYHAFYARLWLRDHPAHEGFFELRRQKVQASI